MTDKQKRQKVHMYQFSVYSPPNIKVIKAIGDEGRITYELSGIDYPYRNKEFDLRWLEAFETR